MQSINCPRCGFNFECTSGVCEPQAKGTTSSAALADLQDVSDLQDRVRGLDELISRLNQDKANVLRRINEIHDKTSDLPSEILSHIFQYVRPPIDFRNRQPTRTSEWETECRYLRRDTYHREDDHHFKLAGVCNRWRQIVLSTPQLWTTISLGIWAPSVESLLSLLDFYSQYAGHLSIAMELDFRFHAIQWMEEEDLRARKATLALLDPIFDAVFIKIAPRIRHLTLIYPPSEISTDFGSNFSVCSSLTVYNATPDTRVPVPHNLVPLTFDITKLPFLQRVCLYNFQFLHDLPWSSITVLDLELMPYSVSFDALTKCPNLLKLRSVDAKSHSLESKPIGAEPIENKSLESLICNDDLGLYHHFRFTRLHTLCWRSIDYPGQCDLRIQIFSYLPPTLVSLTLSEVEEIRRDHVRDLLLCVPQLRELRFFDCADHIVESTIGSIGRIPPSKASSADAPILLPNLCKLSIVDEKVDSRLIIKMLEALHSKGTGEGFHLELFEIVWHTGIRKRLCDLISSGFNVEITMLTEISATYSREPLWW